MEDDQVRLASTRSVVERTAGALKTNQPALTAEELREIAEEVMAKETAERAKA